MIISLIYTAFSSLVYFSFGQKTEPVIIYQLIGEDWFVIAMKILYVLAAWPQYPNSFEPLNHIFLMRMRIKESTLTMTIFHSYSDDEDNDVDDEGRDRGKLQILRGPIRRKYYQKKELEGTSTWEGAMKQTQERRRRFDEDVRLRKKYRNKIILINVFKFIILVSVVLLSLISTNTIPFVFAVLGCLFGMPIYYIIPGYLYWIYGNHTKYGRLSYWAAGLVIAFGTFLMISVPVYYFATTNF